MARKRRAMSAAVLGVIFACYGLARVLEVAPTSIPRTAIVALDVMSAMVFALVHGAQHYRLRGILVFAALCLLVGNALENLSLTTGFPFGHYRFLELMGPKLFQVPVLLGLAYVGMAYVAWTLARMIVGRPDAPVTGVRLVALPAAASFIMVAWDLAQDPVWATVLHGWIWRDGGAWFGVPVSNYFGWFLTVFTIYLLFALYVRRYPSPPSSAQANGWPPILFYALCAGGNVLQLIPAQAAPIVHDAAGTPWRTAEIVSASALVSIFVMGGFVSVASIRLIEERSKRTRIID
ncbi:MAG TPA: carotenoid biosynthesis protein [Terracidiphilus sp.]|jgi:putative membrane protein